MSYLVLARKYRPRTFKELSGQEHVVQTLQGAIRTGRVAHAFLFTGARGVGKTSSARLLAMTLQCKEGPTVEPCGQCEACTEITAGASVDVQEIDGASNNGVDQVRELRDAARYMPSRDRFKIYIIDEVHMLTHPAFNALLKTLEEPPPHVKFVFATTEPHKIPLTILSRTQRFDFRRIPVSKIGARVEEICQAEGITIAPRAVSLVARQAGGSMRDGLSLLDQVVGACGDSVSEEQAEEILGAIDRRVVITLADALISGEASVVLEQIAAVHDRGLDLGHLAEELAIHLRNLLVMQAGAHPRLLLDVSEDEKEELAERAAQVAAAQLTSLFELCQGAVVKVRRAAQPRLTLEVALLSALHLAPTDDLADILAELRGRPRTPSAPRPAPAPGPASSPPASPSPSSSPSSSAARTEHEHEHEHEDGDGDGDGKAVEPPARPEAKAEPAPPPMPEPEARPEPPQRTPARAEKPSITDLASAMAAKAESEGLVSTEPEPAPEPDGPPDRDEPPPLGELTERPGAAAPRPAPPKPAAPKSTAPKPAPEQKPSAPAKPAAESASKAPRLPPGDDPGADVATRYEALASAVMTHGFRPFLASALEHGRPIEIGESTLSLAMPRGLYLDGLGSPANRGLLETFLADHFGRPMELLLEVQDTVKTEALPEAIATIRERELAEHVDRIRESALQNPAVKLAVEALGGEIEDIRILNE